MRIVQGTPIGVIVFVSLISIVLLRFITDKDINLSQIPDFRDYRPWAEAFRKGLTVALASLSDIAIATAALLFIKEIPDRRDKKHYEAWQIIDNAAAAGVPTSQARVKAIQDLNQDNITLEGLDAPDADLRGIEIPGANLRRSNLRSSDLSYSNLEYVDLTDAYLCNIAGRCKGADLYKSNLNATVLERAEANKVNLREAKLVKANLKGANLSDSNLRNSDFTEANLESADLSHTDCRETNFHLSRLKYTNLSNAKNLKKEQLRTAWIYGAILPPELGIDANRDCDKFSEAGDI